MLATLLLPSLTTHTPRSLYPTPSHHRATAALCSNNSHKPC